MKPVGLGPVRFGMVRPVQLKDSMTGEPVAFRPEQAAKVTEDLIQQGELGDFDLFTVQGQPDMPDGFYAVYPAHEQDTDLADFRRGLRAITSPVILLDAETHRPIPFSPEYTNHLVRALDEYQASTGEDSLVFTLKLHDKAPARSVILRKVRPDDEPIPELSLAPPVALDPPPLTPKGAAEYETTQPAGFTERLRGLYQAFIEKIRPDAEPLTAHLPESQEREMLGWLDDLIERTIH